MPSSGPFWISPADIDIDHQVQEALCHDLERVADALPGLPTPDKVRRLAERVDRVVEEHFPRAEALFASMPDSERPTEQELRRLRNMHTMDAVHGEDLIDIMWDRVCDRSTGSQNDLAYMLRCFFDGCRRAIAYKESLLARGQRMPVNPDRQSPQAAREKGSCRNDRLSPVQSRRLFAAG